MNKERCTQIEKEAYCNKGWPEKCSLKGPVKLYASFAAELTVQNGLLRKRSWLLRPVSIQLDMLDVQITCRSPRYSEMPLTRTSFTELSLNIGACLHLWKANFVTFSQERKVMKIDG